MWPPVRSWIRRPSANVTVSIPSVAVTTSLPALIPSTSISQGRWPALSRIAPSANSSLSVAPDHALGARHGDDHVGAGDRALSIRHGESVQERLEPQHRVDLDDRDQRPRASEVVRHAAPAGAVAEHRHPLAVRAAVRDPDERLEHALADGVLVLGELLDRAVVDDEDRPSPAARAAARAVLGRRSSPRCRRGATGTGPRASARRGRRRCRGSDRAEPRAPRAGSRRARRRRPSGRPTTSILRDRADSRRPRAGSS